MGSRRPRPKHLAKKLLQIRLAFDLSQDLMRTRLGFGHIHPGRISEYETGKREPSLPTLLAYARLAGVHVDDLIDDEIDLPTQLPGNIHRGVLPRDS